MVDQRETLDFIQGAVGSNMKKSVQCEKMDCRGEKQRQGYQLKGFWTEFWIKWLLKFIKTPKLYLCPKVIDRRVPDRAWKNGVLGSHDQLRSICWQEYLFTRHQFSRETTRTLQFPGPVGGKSLKSEGLYI